MSLCSQTLFANVAVFSNLVCPRTAVVGRKLLWGEKPGGEAQKEQCATLGTAVCGLCIASCLSPRMLRQKHTVLCDKAPLKCLWLAQRCVQDDLQPHGHAFSSWSSCCADECKTENGQIGLVNLGLQCIAVLNNDNVGEHCFLSATFTVTAVVLSQLPTCE